MKDFNELTNEEVFNLSPNEIDIYRKIAMAQSGVKFPVKPEPPQIDNEKPDLRIYTIDGISDKWDNLCFEKLEDAEEFVALIKKAKGIAHKKSESYNGIYYLQEGLPLDWQKHAPSLAINSEIIFSKEKYFENKKKIDENKKLLTIYNEKLARYDNDLKKAKEATEEVDDRISEVNEDFEYKQEMTRIFVRDYLPISEGDEQIAMKFLERAYTLTESDKNYILEHKDGKIAKS